MKIIIDGKEHEVKVDTDVESKHPCETCDTETLISELWTVKRILSDDSVKSKRICKKCSDIIRRAVA